MVSVGIRLACAGLPDQGARLVEAELVATAELLGGPFDVCDPLAVLAGVAPELGVTRGDALPFHRERLVDEPP